MIDDCKLFIVTRHCEIHDPASSHVITIFFRNGKFQFQFIYLADSGYDCKWVTYAP